MTPRAPRPATFRSHLQRSVLGALAVVAIWHMAVRPMAARLDADRRALAASTAAVHDAQFVADAEGDLAGEAAALRARTQRLFAWSEVSGDPGRLYEQFRAIAAESAVRIERIEPGAPRAAGRPAAGEPVAEVFSCTVDVTGDYEHIVRFIDACERSLGSGRVNAVRLAPVATPAGGAVAATIETAHLRLSRPAVQAAPRPVLKPQSMGTRP